MLFSSEDASPWTPSEVDKHDISSRLTFTQTNVSRMKAGLDPVYTSYNDSTAWILMSAQIRFMSRHNKAVDSNVEVPKLIDLCGKNSYMPELQEPYQSNKTTGR